MTTARWQGTVIAESDDTTVVEGNHYFPAESVRSEYLRPSATTTVCGWKGTAEYYTIDVGGATNPDAAWYYAEPKPGAAHVRGRIAFWRGVEISE
ncbi:DUF427 domain-containing protein [Kitasatospora sp. NPDC047058]|uniref:DUF427 domain-containing protein n=1 Tax=Kitasatospora sp. NPDC047058 TaxID=3155620 RepID=UPI0033D955C8